MNNRSAKLKKNFIVFITCFLAFNFLVLTGQETAEKTEEKEVVTHPTFVDVIVVEGEAVAETSTVQMVTAKQIEDKGCKTVAEALEMVPGTHVRIGGKEEAYIRIRGFNQREVALLVDGIPISSPYDGQLDLSSLPVESIDRIEIVKGASSVLYGSNAMGGVVNIITKKSDGTNRISFNGQYGTGKNTDLGASVQGSLGKIRYLLLGSYLNRDYSRLSGDYGSFRNQEAGARENSDKQAWSGKVSLGWDMGKQGKAALSFSHIDQEKGLPHHESDSKAKFWRFTDWREGILDFVFQDTLGSLSYKSKVYYQYFENVLDSYDDRTYTTQEGKNGFTDTLKDYAFGGDVFFRLSLKEKHLLKLAVRFRQDTHRQQSDVEEPWRRYKMNTVSLPLEGEWTPTPSFTLIYGASFDFMNFRALDEGTGESNSASSFNPQVAGIVRLTESLHLRASASRKTRFPTLRELFSTTSGNPDLDTMKSNIFELGFDYRPMNNLSFSLVGFYNDVKDLINRLQKDDPYINIDQAVFKGVEATVDWQFLKDARLSAAYTHLLSEDKTTVEQDYIQYRPKHKLDVRFQFRLPYDFHVGLYGSYVSSQVYYLNSEELTLDPHTVVDINLSKQLAEKWQVFVRVGNLFDVNYYESEGYPREGRSISAGIRFGGM